MSNPVIKLTYDEAGQLPLVVDQAGYIKWPMKATTQETFSIHAHMMEKGFYMPRRIPLSELSEELNVQKQEDLK